MDKKGKIEYWINSSEKDYVVFKSLYESGHYNWSLFIGHLVVEKLLKALYIKTNDESAPKIHDLRRLASKSMVELNDNQKETLDKITTFNIEARYESEKSDFYEKSTKEYTEYWFRKIEEIRKWLIKKL